MEAKAAQCDADKVIATLPQAQGKPPRRYENLPVKRGKDDAMKTHAAIIKDYLKQPPRTPGFSKKPLWCNTFVLQPISRQRQLKQQQQ